MIYIYILAQCNSKLLSIKTVLQTSTENSQAPTDTNKLYLNNSGNIVKDIAIDYQLSIKLIKLLPYCP